MSWYINHCYSKFLSLGKKTSFLFSIISQHKLVGCWNPSCFFPDLKIYLHFLIIPRQGWGQFNSGIGIAGQFQFQFQQWNWNWNLWNWKWNWNWKPWNWNWKPEWNFLQLLPQHLPVNQPFPNFSFNRGGHDLSCDWLLMQQVCLGTLPPQGFCWPYFVRGHFDLKCTKGI